MSARALSVENLVLAASGNWVHLDTVEPANDKRALRVWHRRGEVCLEFQNEATHRATEMRFTTAEAQEALAAIVRATVESAR